MEVCVLGITESVVCDIEWARPHYSYKRTVILWTNIDIITAILLHWTHQNGLLWQFYYETVYFQEWNNSSECNVDLLLCETAVLTDFYYVSNKVLNRHKHSIPFRSGMIESELCSCLVEWIDKLLFPVSQHNTQ